MDIDTDKTDEAVLAHAGRVGSPRLAGKNKDKIDGLESGELVTEI